MTNTIKTLLIALIGILAIALIVGQMRSSPASGVGTVQPPPVVEGPFTGMPLRFDGYYRNKIGELLYLIRFFPEGRVVTVNGSMAVEKDLPKYLVRETQGNPGLGLHNVRVNVVGDSIVFITHPEKGEIEYRGAVVSGSMVRLMRHSHITGTKQLMEYIFYPDSIPSQ
ncbi:MAG TPA: hypothetical protein PLB89_01650 [Flavobacteriales bacterium]|nr:hypothetical protein [Flavobacteriales bacterium]